MRIAVFRTLVWILVAWACSSGSGREWRDPTGRYGLEAELVDVSDGTVLLRRANGEILSVGIEKLCEADRRYLIEWERESKIELDGPGLTLVERGKPLAVIVTNGRPREGVALAATELQEHIRLMSGATLPIVAENRLEAADASKVLILLGSSNRAGALGADRSELSPEGFLIRTTDNALLLVGEDGGSTSNPRTGTLWAVYDFLQDQLGCRWIWPGEIGRVVPKRETIVIGPLDLLEEPLIKVRGMRMVTQEKHRVGYEKEGLGQMLDLGAVYQQVSEDERTWLRRMRMGRSFKMSYGHGFTDWWEKHRETSPEVFALQPNGRRGPRRSDRPDFTKMCVSNPTLWELQLAKIRKYAAEGARGQWLNACENDGSGGFCVCGRCRAWDADPNVALDVLPPVEDGSDVDAQSTVTSDLPDSLSDRYARWYNELAKRVRQDDPEARVIAYAYSRYRSPPTKITTIEPNVWIGYVGFNAYPRTEAYRQMSTDEWLGWSQRGATVFLRSNSLFYCGEGVPHVVTRQMAQDTRFQVANGLRATDYDCLQGNWATGGPSYYVFARLLWDTEADVDRLLDEYYGAFGPMGDIVRQYDDYWETFTTRLADDPTYSQLNRTERLQAFPKYYTNAVFTQAATLLGGANSQLPTATEPQRERFRNVEFALEHGRLLVAALADGKTSNGPEGERLMRLRREIASRNVVNVYWTTSKEKRYHVFE